MNRGHRIAVAWQIFLEAGLLVALPLVFYRPFVEQFGTPKIILTEWLVTAGLAGSALAYFGRRPPAPRAHFAWPITLLAGAVLLSCVNSPSPGFSLDHARYFLCGPAWLLVLDLSAGGAASMKRLSVLMASAAALVALIILAQWLGHDPLLFGGFHVVRGSMVERMNLYSTFGNPNFAAGYLVGLAFMPWALGLVARNLIAKLLWFSAAGAVLLAIVVTQSHGAWAALGAGLLIWLWTLRSRPPANLEAGATVVATRREKESHASASVVFLAPPFTLLAAPMFSNLPERLLDQLAGRIYLWRLSWPLFTHHPILGSGWGSLQLRFLDLQAEFLASHPDQIGYWSNISQLHNDPLQLLLEAGVLGLAAFLCLAWTYTRKFRASLRAADAQTCRLLSASAAGAAAIMVDSLFNFQFAVPPTLILFFTLIAFPALVFPAHENDRAREIGLRSTSLRILGSVAALGCAAFLFIQTANFAGAEIGYARGMQLEMMGDAGLSAARQAFRDGIALNPRSGRIHFGLGRILFVQRNFPEALAEAEIAGRTYSDSHLEVLKGRIQQAMGRSAAALATYRHALALDPTLKTVQIDIERLEKEIK
jgi:O-antigen ligase